MEFEVLQKVLVEVLNVAPSEIHMDTTIVGDLGADSLDIFQILLRIEEELGVELEPKKIEKISTVEQAVALLKKAEK